MHSKESKPSRGETSSEKETHETNNNKLHRTTSYVRREGHKSQSGNAPDETETTQIKSLKPNKVGLHNEVPKSKEQNSGQPCNVSESSVKESKGTNAYDPFIYIDNGKKLIWSTKSS